MSVFILTNGKSYKMLPIAKDYKRIGENDTGLNTGGMGAVHLSHFMNQDLLKKWKQKLFSPQLGGSKKQI